MLNALTVTRAGDKAKREKVVASCEAQGFRIAGIEAPLHEPLAYEARLWSYPNQDSVPNAVISDARGFACCVGTLFYKGSFGTVALDRLLGDFRGPQTLTDESLRGSFVVLLRNASGSWLFNDPMGFARIYVTEDRGCFSTSWLAARSWVGSADLDAAAAAEYVLIESVHGAGTAAPGVGKLPLGSVVDLAESRIVSEDSALSWSVGDRFEDFESAVHAMSQHYSQVFSEIVSAFPAGVNSALSGGFDSRMIVAGVLASGVAPRLFVYGSDGSTDVSVARSVASAVGLPIRVVDKAALDRARPDPDPDALVRSALFFDGLPNDGIVDRGSDRATRLEQNEGGAIALNGGGGEILRNFFHLPDRRFSALDLVRTFYRGFDAGAFRRAQDLVRYEERLSASIEAAVGGAGVLSREQIELAFPLFRCHYWMGTNNTVELRHGYFSTPLVDRTTVRMAARVPLRWKNAGRFQSALISLLHPLIAAQDSAYGFPVAAGPGLRARFSEWLTCARPVLLRPTINATHRRLRRMGVDPSQVRKWRSLLPGEWRVDSILDLERLPDDKSFERALSLEIVNRMIAP